jgi:hypothetical protein
MRARSLLLDRPVVGVGKPGNISRLATPACTSPERDRWVPRICAGFSDVSRRDPRTPELFAFARSRTRRVGRTRGIARRCRRLSRRRTPLARLRAVRLRPVRRRLHWPRLLRSVVIHIPARSLELNRRRGNHPLHFTVARWALFLFRSAEALDLLKLMSALLAAVFIKRHSDVPRESKKSKAYRGLGSSGPRSAQPSGNGNRPLSLF